jgi:plastocyanin
VAVLGAAVLLCLAMAPTAAAKRTVHTVIIKAVMYAPAMLMVERDDVIVWKNEDPVPHTVTFDKAALDSGSIAPAQSWRYVARRPGDYPYHCTFHPNMHGTLHVK